MAGESLTEEVSIPRRYAKNEDASIPIKNTGQLVSIPRRYAKNLLIYPVSSRLIEVSIPRRYAKNWFEVFIEVFLGPLFQSLVGTLKTFQCLRSPFHIGEFQSLVGTLKTTIFSDGIQTFLAFQSLVGTLKTGRQGGGEKWVRKFQSLVGTLKTWQRQKKFAAITGVSIPRRYAKNSSNASPVSSVKPSFNPS